MKITNIDAATGSNTEITVTKSELIESIGEIVIVKPFEQLIEERENVKLSALNKLTALGLTEDEAKAIVG